ncbi:PAS domain-containing protein [Archaeoglobus neptunius]|uniref:PAS domain-containing protein n=1 Tax=Archaeoglobus neptunius TaxID=2798580 RepID=UPI001926BBFA|nr:PAS domain S-box protein [Archaeoglobus neptunius]
MNLNDMLRILPDVLDELNEIVYVCDTDWNILYANKMARKILHYEAGKVNLRDIIAKEYLSTAQKRFNEILKSGKPLEKPAEYLIKTKDGKDLWVEVKTRPIFENGKLVAILGIARDVTERKLLELRLRDAEEKFRKIFENTPNIVVLIDSKGTIVEANPAAVRSVGMNPVGKNLREIFSREVAERRLSHIRKVLKDGRSLTVMGERDGRHFLTHIVPVELSGEKYTLHIVQEITRLVRVNNMLEVIKEINKLMVYEKDKMELVSKAAEKLRHIRHMNCWVGITEEDSVFLPSIGLRTTGDDVNCLIEAIKTGREVFREGEVEDCRKCRFYGEHRTMFRCALPMMVKEEVKGGLVVQAEKRPSDDELDLIKTLSGDLAFAIKAIEIDEAERWAYEQISRNIDQMAFLVDRIRNPLAAARGFTEIYVEDEKIRRKINEQHERILELVRQLEDRWEESERVRNLLGDLGGEKVG